MHNIIAESVERILMEMDGEGYRKGMERHPNLMNKGSPETYNKLARKSAESFILLSRKRADDVLGLIVIEENL